MMPFLMSIGHTCHYPTQANRLQHFAFNFKSSWIMGRTIHERLDISPLGEAGRFIGCAKWVILASLQL